MNIQTLKHLLDGDQSAAQFLDDNFVQLEVLSNQTLY